MYQILLLFNGCPKKASEKILYKEEIIDIDNKGDLNEVTLSSGKVIKTNLIISSDGKNSKLANKIPKSDKDYFQTALTFLASAEKDMNMSAFQIFSDNGICAFMPTRKKERISLPLFGQYQMILSRMDMKILLRRI